MLLTTFSKRGVRFATIMDEHLFSQQSQAQAGSGANQGQSGLGNAMPIPGMNPPGMPQNPKPMNPALLVPMVEQVTGLATRLKLAEERYTNLSKRNQLTESSLLGFERDIRAELKALSKQLSDLRKKIGEINTKLDAVNGELGVVVRKHEFLVLEKYLDMWQPLQFVTREEAARLIRDSKFEVVAGPTASTSSVAQDTKPKK